VSLELRLKKQLRPVLLYVTVRHVAVLTEGSGQQINLSLTFDFLIPEVG
jgi:hypothetical protein